MMPRAHRCALLTLANILIAGFYLELRARVYGIRSDKSRCTRSLLNASNPGQLGYSLLVPSIDAPLDVVLL